MPSKDKNLFENFGKSVVVGWGSTPYSRNNGNIEMSTFGLRGFIMGLSTN